MVNFKNLREKLIDYINSEMSKDDFTSYLDENIEVEKYLSQVSKYTAIGRLSLNFQTNYLDKLISGDLDISPDYFYMMYDITSLFELLFAYTNIKVDKEDINDKNYDLIYKSGLYKYIVNKTDCDYINLKEKCDRVIGINDITVLQKLSEFVEKNMNIFEFNEAITKMEKVMKNKKISENLKLLNNVEMFNNPSMAAIIEQITTAESGENI